HSCPLPGLGTHARSPPWCPRHHRNRPCRTRQVRTGLPATHAAQHAHRCYRVSGSCSSVLSIHLDTQSAANRPRVLFPFGGDRVVLIRESFAEIRSRVSRLFSQPLSAFIDQLSCVEQNVRVNLDSPSHFSPSEEKPMQ